MSTNVALILKQINRFRFPDHRFFFGTHLEFLIAILVSSEKACLCVFYISFSPEVDRPQKPKDNEGKEVGCRDDRFVIRRNGSESVLPLS